MTWRILRYWYILGLGARDESSESSGSTWFSNGDCCGLREWLFSGLGVDEKGGGGPSVAKNAGEMGKRRAVASSFR